MIKAEQVPKEASAAVEELFDEGFLHGLGLHPETIVAAALNAWPGMEFAVTRMWDGQPITPHLRLPFIIEQENTNERE